jgi:hypothetical protein
LPKNRQLKSRIVWGVVLLISLLLVISRNEQVTSDTDSRSGNEQVTTDSDSRSGSVWFFTFEDSGQNAVVVHYSSDGTLERFAVPPQAYNFLEPYPNLEAALSPNHRTVAILASIYQPFSVRATPPDDPLPIALVDFDTIFCCNYVSAPFPNVREYGLGKFSPDGTQFAFAYTVESDDEGGEQSGVLIADAATGEILSTLTSQRLNEAFPYDQEISIRAIDAWEDNEIFIYRSCRVCDVIQEESYYVWNPEQDTFALSWGNSATEASRFARGGYFLSISGGPPIPFGDNEHYLTEAGVGFLTQNTSGEVRHFQLREGQWNTQTVGQFHYRVKVLDSPSVIVTFVTPPPHVRLTIGEIEYLREGMPGSMRDNPWEEGALITQIPLGATFRVLDGPVGGGGGIYWWEVEYDGLVGWLAERDLVETPYPTRNHNSFLDGS